MLTYAAIALMFGMTVASSRIGYYGCYMDTLTQRTENKYECSTDALLCVGSTIGDTGFLACLEIGWISKDAAIFRLSLDANGDHNSVVVANYTIYGKGGHSEDSEPIEDWSNTYNYGPYNPYPGYMDWDTNTYSMYKRLEQPFGWQQTIDNGKASGPMWNETSAVEITGVRVRAWKANSDEAPLESKILANPLKTYEYQVENNFNQTIFNASEIRTMSRHKYMPRRGLKIANGK